MRDNDLILRKLCDCEKDYRLLERWYQEKSVYDNFEQRMLNYDEIKKKYYPRTLENTDIPVFVIEFNNRAIGIIQYKKINDEDRKIYNIIEDNCYEIDIFIGEVDCRNKGLGKRSIELISNYLFNELDAKILVMCPLKENVNAIKCYLKCGFRIMNEFVCKNTIGVLSNYVLMVRYI